MADNIRFEHCIKSVPHEYEDDAASPMCIGTPSEPGSPERPVGTMGNVSAFGDLDGIQSMQWIPALGWDCAPDYGCAMACCGGCGTDFMAPGGPEQGMGIWAVQQIVDTNGCTQWIVPIPSAGADCGGCGGNCGPDDCSGGYGPCDGGAVVTSHDSQSPCVDETMDAAQMVDHYCWDAHREDEEFGIMQKRLLDLEQHRSQMQRNWERERENLLRELDRYREVLHRYAIPVEEATDRALAPCFPKISEQPGRTRQKSEEGECAKGKRFDGFAAGEEEHLKTPRGGTESTVSPGDESNSNPEADEHTSKIATAIKTMFPGSKVCSWSEIEAEKGTLSAEHDMRRRGSMDRSENLGFQDRFSRQYEFRRRVGSMADPQVDDLATKLETNTRSVIDDRALHALQSLPVYAAMEALQKVDDLVESQGGSCRNLSSILQSVCRKVERKGPRDMTFREKMNNSALPERSHTEQHRGSAAIAPERTVSSGRRSQETLAAPACDTSKVEVAPSGGGKLTRRATEENSESFVSSEGEGQSTRWADIEDDQDTSPTNGAWTQKQVENVAPRHFELIKNEAGQWHLKLSMADMKPAFTESAMEFYCNWLHAKLTDFRRSHGEEPLRHCCGDVDFSSNELGDHGVWRLMETLVQNEVQVAVLKLFKNKISDAGAYAISEFVRGSQHSGPLCEMHLSHNSITDDAALDLLVALHRQGSMQYPPCRHALGTRRADHTDKEKRAPVWVRLNQNHIKNPADVLKALENEGVTFCKAQCATDCGPTKCKMKDCPLLHVYLFADQAVVQQAKTQAAESDGSSPTGTSDRPGRKRNGRQKYRGKVGSGEVVQIGDSDPSNKHFEHKKV